MDCVAGISGNTNSPAGCLCGTAGARLKGAPAPPQGSRGGHVHPALPPHQTILVCPTIVASEGLLPLLAQKGNAGDVTGRDPEGVPETFRLPNFPPFRHLPSILPFPSFSPTTQCPLFASPLSGGLQIQVRCVCRQSVRVWYFTKAGAEAQPGGTWGESKLLHNKEWCAFA